MIEIRELSVSRNGTRLLVLPELSVGAGERVCLWGGNGTGKSTLLRVLAGLETGFAGRCRVGAALEERTLVQQSPYLLRGTAMFNVLYPLRARGIRGHAAEARAREELERFGAGELAGRRVHELSGGEVRRVALARALVLDPVLLLLDEPFSDLDEDGICRVREGIGRLVGTTVVFVSPLPMGDAEGGAGMRRVELRRG